ncbi:GvpL/GvpF family gas vesicle protein [Actinocatenispora rupis]|uniref:Gas vesicle protein n=1 Tax=Actinocatenispora rupis TaxID=519421 RepID=A0A8J3NEX2_9ACTN|nr:GvpL/GvpF family gas vesicle protein [Actinocatenispora rupis]GID14587.1 gas vesicle protein [Actinocatenispora rupis]
MTAVWVYAVTEARTPPTERGVHGEPLRTVRCGDLTAVVGTVPDTEYGPEPLRRNLIDALWLEQVARAHHRVVTAAARDGPVVPQHLATVYADDAGVTALLRNHPAELHAILDRLTGRAEWGVKAYAPSVVPEETTEQPSGVADLARERARRTAVAEFRRVGAAVAERVDAWLAPLAVARCRHEDGDPWEADAPDPPVLNASYLVDDARRGEFADRVGAVARTDRVELSGPWPPYSFAELPKHE